MIAVNTKELALEQVRRQLQIENIEFNNFIITDQYVSLDMVEIKWLELFV